MKLLLKDFNFKFTTDIFGFLWHVCEQPLHAKKFLCSRHTRPFQQEEILIQKNFKGFLFDFGIELSRLSQLSFLSFIVFHHRVRQGMKGMKLLSFGLDHGKEGISRRAWKTCSMWVRETTLSSPMFAFFRIICFRQIRAFLFTLISFHAA